jgi:hypothetical protein
MATLGAKLSLSVAAFLLVGYCGRFHDRRVTGVLLTFPILNVIGLLSAGEPRRAADTICVVVIWNTLLFVAILTWLARARDARAPPHERTGARVLLWAALWLAGATATTLLLGYAPPPRWLWLLALALAAGYALFAWRAAPPAPAAPRDRGRHRAQLRQFFDADLAKRLGLLVLAFAALATVSLLPLDSRWTGMLSAFPLPGIFALATLSTRLDASALRQIRDTVLAGSLLVIPFNVLFAERVLALPADPLRFLLLGSLWGVLFWLAAAVLVFSAVPRIAGMLDRLKR